MDETNRDASQCGRGVSQFMLDDLQLAAELGKTLLERNKELEIFLKEYKCKGDEQEREIVALINELMALQAVEPGSVVMLRELSDKFNSHMRALQGLGTTEQIAGCIVVQRCRSLETMDFSMASYASSGQVGRSRKHNNSRSTLVTTNQTVARCALCNDSAHEVQYCQKFKALSPTNRHKEAKRLSLCINFL
ncbi:uncharacterized protein LOC117186604 isoform X8 [Drosophila miranda]|uniref:uncharacterized protein LOC117186604 isoform X8 n=1 Tax=Drosophila miranda TaxID=7229 RepID=UPI00143F708D|nr:uncharacterized protein LOC117186604 isoform X8 [Drosophila miranda]